MSEAFLSDFSEYQQALSDGKTNCVIQVKTALKLIEQNHELNAFLETFENSALQKAEEIDARRHSGTIGKLGGMIIGIKDNICYRNHKISASSRILEGFTSLYSATAVEKLIEEDAIIIGRLNCDEFAMGSSNENSAFGNVSNPHDGKRVSGGSSGGSAAAVAAGLCHAALGSDTGGSIRQPASFTGTFGLKPTYGRISRWGLIAYGSSLDQIGPISNTVRESSLLFDVMSGQDEHDTTSVPDDLVYKTEKELSDKPKIALLKEAMEVPGLRADVKTYFTKLIEDLRKSGAEVETVSFPYLDFVVPTYYIISNAEASSNLSRYDGIHYGYRSENGTDIESTITLSRSEGFGKEVKRRIMMGTFVLSAGYSDAYYVKAQKVRRLIKESTERILKKFDFILTPTTPHSAFKKGEILDPITMYLEDIYTVHANLAGIPAVSVPLAEDHAGLPFGVQLMAGPFQEKSLLKYSDFLMNRF
ncbi:MAG TPA: Asp-tRNA(Asn)/Glu-tRNA(Gln) amidotransferase GatCAB subunit A [Flavobacteriales bacterium]|nr:Asp-tRNA(Asn)/Glu-tRNA(Gln) amidotransferase GatCAB subunit A [Flavobacteriales bacterium]